MLAGIGLRDFLKRVLRSIFAPRVDDSYKGPSGDLTQWDLECLKTGTFIRAHGYWGIH